LEGAYRALPETPVYRFLRKPETGTVMVRGRIGGTGSPFHLGEATVTRCTVQVNGGAAGTGYVMGRSARRAELVAVFDALLQDQGERPRLEESVLASLHRKIADRRSQSAARAAATRVNFFTMARGE
jgi:alpha-D-ribose 1-methylphosphonate 5-triphosphate synthase subunit PhnG